MHPLDLIIRAMERESGSDGGRDNRAPRADCSRARELAAEYNKAQEPFKIGDQVRWKPGMRNARFPIDGEACTVIETFPTRQDRNEKSAYDLEPIDMRLAFVDENGELLAFTYDSHRFEAVPPQDAAPEPGCQSAAGETVAGVPVDQVPETVITDDQGNTPCGVASASDEQGATLSKD